ncbi:MAG: hypothetical protein NW226_05680 [Microscillaceae bacterium]|nr:hypothetical protein [Microscillaceae bacterium]
MSVKKLLPKICLFFGLLSACHLQKQDAPKTLIHTKDYEVFFKKMTSAQENLSAINQEIEFWASRIRRGNHSHLYYNKVASQLAKRFRVSGDPSDLHQSDSLLRAADSIAVHQHVGSLHNLVYNAITQHKFQEALNLGLKAEKIGERRYISHLLLTDIHQELGNLTLASNYLAKLPNKGSFDYLVRKSKLTDAQGNLDSAIFYMEQALAKVSPKSQNDLYYWAKSNLGDMYGHQGEVQKSYKAYLEVLNFNPNNYHVWKGIAWIAFSHDQNTTEAKRIIQRILHNTRMPDLHLMLAEIAEFEGDQQTVETQLQAFKAEISKKEYGNMYLSPLAKLQADYLKNYEEALKIARKEIQNRPNATSYALNAWILHLKGQSSAALKIAQEFVEGYTEEPEVMYQLGIIFKANGKHEQAEKFLEQAHESSFELGPVLSQQIEKELKSLRKSEGIAQAISSK